MYALDVLLNVYFLEMNGKQVTEAINGIHSKIHSLNTVIDVIVFWKQEMQKTYFWLLFSKICLFSFMYANLCFHLQIIYPPIE